MTRKFLHSHREMNGKKMNLSRTYNYDKLFEDVEFFTDYLEAMIKDSTRVENFNDYLYQRQEEESIARFEEKCKILRIPFERY